MEQSSKFARRYDAEFKRNAVALVKTGRRLGEAARDLGCSTWFLGRWVYAADQGQGLSESQTLAAVGRALLGEDKDKLKVWLKPLVRQLRNESAVKVIRELEQVLRTLPDGPTAAAVSRELDYFCEHRERMDYRAAQRAGEPIGRGPVEWPP